MALVSASGDDGGTEIFTVRGGDKAPLAPKAEAKARRYQPLISIVDESARQTARRLTCFDGSWAKDRLQVQVPDFCLAN
jgi:hypothetical protein